MKLKVSRLELQYRTSFLNIATTTYDLTISSMRQQAASFNPAGQFLSK
jgi:hypothetical protein